MYKKILIPTDGSPVATVAAHAGIAFAKEVDADVVGIFVAPEYQFPVYVEVIPADFPTEDSYRASMREAGQAFLAKLRKQADTLGVSYSDVIVFSDAIAQEIVRAAETHDCDLIFIGSHGRSGWGQALLGSVTTKVLSACEIPVLVYRIRKDAQHSTDEK